MKFVDARPYSDPETTARKLMELANAFEPIQDGRIYIEKLNWPFLSELKGTPAEYRAGLDLCIAKGSLVMPRERHLCPDDRDWRRAVRLIPAQGTMGVERPCRRRGRPPAELSRAGGLSVQ